MRLKKSFWVFMIVPMILSCLLISSNTPEEGKQFVSAFPELTQVTQPDGEKLSVKLKGDEVLHLYTTSDGYTVLQDKKGNFEFAEIDKKGDLVSSGIKAADPEKRSLKQKNFLKGKKKRLDFSDKQKKEAKDKWKKKDSGIDSLQWGGVTGQFPTTGTRNMLIILGDFSDLSFTKSNGNFDDIFNNGSSSFKQYHSDNSFNQLTVNSTVVGPFTPNITAANADNDIRTYIATLVDMAEASGLDFSNYDNNNDGYVDGLFVVHAGYGEEAGAPSWAIWAHAWTLYTQARTYDGVTIDRYATVPELRSNSGSTITGIGVCVHEFGHLLGAPDLYDTDGTSSGGESWDCEKWDVMSSGSWNNNGDTPPHHSMYSKMKMGWSTPTVLSSATSVTLNNSATTNTAYRVNTPTTNEYFILENRQQSGWDAYLPGHGMLIFHIDGPTIDSLGSNSVNVNPSHQNVDIEEADNSRSSSTYGGDPFPGTSNNNSFTDTTTPNSKAWNGANTNKPITNIAENSGVISFDFMSGGVTGYCTASSNNISDEWIAGIQVGSLSKTSGAAYYSDFTYLTGSLTPGASTSVTLTPGFTSTAYTEHWKIWIDYNADNDFDDAGEEVFYSYGTTTRTGSFTVASSATGPTRMRIAMKYNSAPTPCGTFTYGEVEDYTVDFSAPVVTYCTASGNNSNYEWIAGVQVGSMNKTSGAAGYTDFTSTTCNLTAGASTSVTLTPGFSSSTYNEYWKIYIDYNKDGDFTDAGEEVFASSGTTARTGSFTVSSSATGTTRMRVIMNYSAWPTPCGTFTYGEVEDYTVSF